MRDHKRLDLLEHVPVDPAPNVLVTACCCAALFVGILVAGYALRSFFGGAA